MSRCRHLAIRPAVLLVAAAVTVLVGTASADELVGTNGERFVGRIVEEKPDSVIVSSEIAGTITVPRAKIRQLLRSPPETVAKPAPTQTPSVTNLIAAASNAPPTNVTNK